jgi:DNA primase
MSLTQKTRETMERATAQYQQDVALAKEYLMSRGIDGHTAKQFRLGVVARPIIGHEQYVGRLAIPYLTPSGVVDIRFRCITNHGEQSCKDVGHGKYLSQPGHKTRLYYTNAIMAAGDTIAITEGEMDAIILNKIGIPAVGVPGAQAWQSSYYPRIFSDFSNILIFGDGDDAGKNFARQIAKELEDVVIVDMPQGGDVNDTYLKEGEQGLLTRAGLLKTETESSLEEDVF